MEQHTTGYNTYDIRNHADTNSAMTASVEADDWSALFAGLAA
ncbi:hypothetical protein DSM100688_1758 [Bifidobacterium ramosum]|uniref:Uncharacterized protein n=1 Tax=Bifidobacterium ramosum TaxID=1798158 RepID=A0A6L4WZI3_9BIFI|nr:hypothetical protein [Bifidobacterium ramosum]KAB8287183.1 hypothetical protein DSM100688_1758 [Bifidobacterium ramosum]